MKTINEYEIIATSKQFFFLQFATITNILFSTLLCTWCLYNIADCEISAKCPDPTADIGHHSFRYALYPHTGTFQESGVIQEAYNFNEPLLVRPVPVPEPRSFFAVNKSAVIIETVKKAEDSDDVIVRLYESHGGRCDVTLTSSLPVKRVTRCNLLEEDEKGDNAAALQWNNNSVTFSVKPFQILTFKLHL